MYMWSARIVYIYYIYITDNRRMSDIEFVHYLARAFNANAASSIYVWNLWF